MLGLLINRWTITAITGLLLLGFVYFKAYTHGKRVVQKEWYAQKVELERQDQEWKDKARETERALQDKVNKAQKEKLNAVKTANAKYAALVNSLRDRPEGRADEQKLSDDSGNVVGCTGAGLARPDAEFLAGYSADAARLQAAYNSCRQAYEVIENATFQTSP